MSSKKSKTIIISTPPVSPEDEKNWMDEVKKQWGEDNAAERLSGNWNIGHDLAFPSVFSYFDEFDHVIQELDQDYDQDQLAEEYNEGKRTTKSFKKC